MFHQPEDLTVHLGGLPSIPWLYQCLLDFFLGPQTSRFSFSQSDPMHLMALALQLIYRKLPLVMNHIKVGSEGRQFRWKGRMQMRCSYLSAQHQ